MLENERLQQKTHKLLKTKTLSVLNAEKLIHSFNKNPRCSDFQRFGI